MDTKVTLVEGPIKFAGCVLLRFKGRTNLLWKTYQGLSRKHQLKAKCWNK